MAKYKLRINVTLEIEGKVFREGCDIAFTYNGMRYIACIKTIVLEGYSSNRAALLLNDVEVRPVGKPPKYTEHKELFYVSVADITDVDYVTVS